MHSETFQTVSKTVVSLVQLFHNTHNSEKQLFANPICYYNVLIPVSILTLTKR